MTISPRPFFIAALLAIGFSLFTTGCEDSVNPFIEDDRFFSIYGYLDTGSDQQYARVVPLRTLIGASDDTTIDAVVTTTARESGQTVAWRDSVIQFNNGITGHVFHAPFRPVPGWTYDFVVERSDGATTRAATTIPLAPNVIINPPLTVVTNTRQIVLWEDIDFAPFRVEVWYRFINARPNEPFLNAVLTYTDAKFGTIRPEGFEVNVLLTNDRKEVADALGVSEDARLALLGVGMRVTMSDEQWRPPNGVFDPEVLVQPGTFTNVENGFGFIGSVNQYTVEWTLEPAVVERIGYSYPGKK